MMAADSQNNINEGRRVSAPGSSWGQRYETVVVCLGLGIKITWLSLGKDHVFTVTYDMSLKYKEKLK